MLSHPFAATLDGTCPYCPDPIDHHDMVRAYNGDVGHMVCVNAAVRANVGAVRCFWCAQAIEEPVVTEDGVTVHRHCHEDLVRQRSEWQAQLEEDEISHALRRTLEDVLIAEWNEVLPEAWQL